MARRSGKGGGGPQPLDTLPGAPQCTIRLHRVAHENKVEAKAAMTQGFAYLSAEGKGVGGFDAPVFGAYEPDRAAAMALAKVCRESGERVVDAWHRTLATENLWPRGSYNERAHFRLMVSPEATFWRRIGARTRDAQAEVMKTITVRMLRLLEQAGEAEYVWAFAVHVNTRLTHSHTLLRGKDVQGKSVWMPAKRRVRHLSRVALAEVLERAVSEREAVASAG